MTDPTDPVVWHGETLTLHNDRTITDYAFSRHLSPSGGVVTEREFDDVWYGRPVFGYVTREWNVTDPDGYPMDVVELIKELPNANAEADKRLILDTDARTLDRLDAFERHNSRASGDLVEPVSYTTHHLYVIHYYTRIPCFTHEERYASAYACITDPDDDTTTIPQAYCGECLGHLADSAERSHMVLNTFGKLRVGQHD